MQENSIYEDVISQLLNRRYAVSNQLFPEETLLGLYEELCRQDNEDELRRAGIGNRFNFEVNKTVRSDEIKWVNNLTEHVAEKNYLSLVSSFTAYLNRTCFTSIKEHEFHYALFSPGAIFKRHLDCFKNDPSRRISVVTYLNPSWEEGYGGALKLYLETEEISILPQWGTTVIFRSDDLEHEVMPAVQKRYSITGWLK